MECSFKRLIQTASLNESYSLRYQVYCRERTYLSALKYSNLLESDIYDEKSHHFCAYGHDDIMIGSVRLVAHSELGFPFEDFYKLPDNILSPETRVTSAEISRLVISKQRLRFIQENYQKLSACSRSEIILGLFKQLYQDSKREGITHWLASMEDTLARLLSAKNIMFEPIGPYIEYYGKVRPYIAKIQDIENHLQESCPDLFDYFSDGMEDIIFNSYNAA